MKVRVILAAVRVVLHTGALGEPVGAIVTHEGRAEFVPIIPNWMTKGNGLKFLAAVRELNILFAMRARNEPFEARADQCTLVNRTMLESKFALADYAKTVELDLTDFGALMKAVRSCCWQSTN